MVCKKLLKKIFTENQWKKLSSFKKKFIDFFSRTLSFICNMLPDRVALNLKTHINIVKKLDYERTNIFLTVNSFVEYDTRLHSCRKEPSTINWIETFFKKGDVMFDIGANIGAYSLVGSKLYDGKIAVYAFEPGFSNFAELCKNILINGCQNSIIPLQIALSDKTVIDNFNYDNITPGGALHTFGKPIDYKGEIFKPVFKQPILGYRIDDLRKQFNIPVPNHIKIDVDGIEFAVLRGAEETLSNPLVKSIISEVEESEGKNPIVEFLINKGFEVHSKHKPTCADTGPVSKIYNYIFLRKPVS